MSGRDAPPLNALVDVQVVGRDEWFRSRVEDTTGPDLVVAAPTGTRGAPVVIRPGDEVVLLWYAGNGPCELPTVLVDATTGSRSVWTLHPTSGPRGATRRSFFRVAMSAPMQLLSEHTPGPATMVDLSEGGLRCSVRGEVALNVGDVVNVAFVLGGIKLVLPASLVRSHAHDLGTELSFRFEDVPRAGSDLIRKELFEQQRRLRARGLV